MKKIPITINYDRTKPPIGCIELAENFDMSKFADGYILAPGYIKEKIKDISGNYHGKITLMEMSLIPYKNYKAKD